MIGLRALAVAALLALVSLAACGVDTERRRRASARNSSSSARSSRSELREFRAAAAELPPLPAGEVQIAGEDPASLTAGAAAVFNRAATGIDVSYAAVGTTAAFDAMCEGSTDVVEVTRPITEAELAECEANGVELAAPLQMASDAIVVTTRNESDVGGDCVGVPDVDAMFRRGSTLDSWAQLGFDELPLRATGPDAGPDLRVLRQPRLR